MIDFLIGGSIVVMSLGIYAGSYYLGAFIAYSQSNNIF